MVRLCLQADAGECCEDAGLSVNELSSAIIAGCLPWSSSGGHAFLCRPAPELTESSQQGVP